jgi:uncharacterized membrane protein
MEENTSDWILFVGRFHPLFLHVPIGFLVLAFILEIMSRFGRFHHYRGPVGFILALGAASAVVTTVLGLMLAQGGGYNDELLSFHQWSGIAVCAFSVLAVALRQAKDRRPSARLHKLYIGTLSALMLTIAAAGHYGGSLTHGSDYLTRYMPAGLRTLAGLPEQRTYEKKVITNLDSAVVYTDIIDPILYAYCTSCHNESKSKGDLMMHTPEAMLAGGETGKLFVPGNAGSSLMIERILLPEDHDDHMPPKGKSQLTDEQIKLLTWWIDEGAPFDKRVAEVRVSDDIKEVLATLVDPDANKSEIEILLASKTSAVSEQTLAQFQIKGVSVEPLSHEIHWLQADVAPFVKADSLLGAFGALSQDVTWLSLAGTATTDSGLSHVGGFKYLTRLHLGNTSVTDKGMQHLKDLLYLESLNLYGTRVSDEGVQHLSGLKNLRVLYLWKTDVTPDGVSRLQKALPDLKVNLGNEVSRN